MTKPTVANTDRPAPPTVFDFADYAEAREKSSSLRQQLKQVTTEIEAIQNRLWEASRRSGADPAEEALEAAATAAAAAGKLNGEVRHVENHDLDKLRRRQAILHRAWQKASAKLETIADRRRGEVAQTFLPRFRQIVEARARAVVALAETHAAERQMRTEMQAAGVASSHLLPFCEFAAAGVLSDPGAPVAIWLDYAQRSGLVDSEEIAALVAEAQS